MTGTRYQWRNEILVEQSGEAIRFYEVDKSRFFERFLAGIHDLEVHRQAMLSLVERYGIRNKRILSVGPGTCEQEYWFSGDGNNILFVDIDEHGSMEPELQSLAADSLNASEKITYGIGDARRVGDYLSEPFDVFLSFSFTPDECHRMQVQQGLRDTNREFGWPVGESPFSSIVLDICTYLSPGGLFISLSYCGGPDATALSYLPAMEETLQKNGMRLLEVYALKDCEGVHLVVAQRLGKENVRPINDKCRISAIHGRAAYGAVPVMLFSAYEDPPDGKSSSLEEEITREIIQAACPDARDCLFDGKLSSEISTLLGRGGNVAVIADANSSHEYRPFPGSGKLDFTTNNDSLGKREFDLVWLASLRRDEARRVQMAPSMALGKTHKRAIFSDETHRLLRRLKKGGTVITYGKVNLEIDSVPSFANQIHKELSVHGINLQDLYALKIATGVFLAIGKKNIGSVKVDLIKRFYPAAENNEAIKIPFKRAIKNKLWRKIRRALFA